MLINVVWESAPGAPNIGTLLLSDQPLPLSYATLQETARQDQSETQAESERDRRQHHRRSTHRSWVEVDGEAYWVVDISLGGLRFEAPHDHEHMGAEIAGVLVYQDDRSMTRMPFRAEVVRVDPSGGTVGATFRNLPDAQIDDLLVILSSVERAFNEARSLQQREQDRRERIAKLTKWLAILTLLGMAGIAGYMVAVGA